MKKTIALAAVLLGSAAVSSLFAQGQVLWGNQFTGALQARVYAPEPSDSTRRLTGNAPNGQPIGTTVYTGAVLQGTGFTMGLFLGSSAAEVAASQTALQTAPFRTGTAAGFVLAQTYTDPTRLPNTSGVNVQFRAWNNLGGTVTSWAQVMARVMAGDSQMQAGFSDPFTVGALGGLDNNQVPPAIIPTPSTAGARSFNLTAVPEPSLIALGALGLGALLLRRRK
jgi:hypothetical protein